MVDEGKTASLGENSPVLVTAHLLIVKEKNMASGVIHQPCELG